MRDQPRSFQKQIIVKTSTHTSTPQPSWVVVCLWSGCEADSPAEFKINNYPDRALSTGTSFVADTREEASRTAACQNEMRYQGRMGRVPSRSVVEITGDTHIPPLRTRGVSNVRRKRERLLNQHRAHSVGWTCQEFRCGGWWLDKAHVLSCDSQVVRVRRQIHESVILP